MDQTIRSRSNKNVGDVIDEKWEITGKRVIADPHPGDRASYTPPRMGIYDYEVKPLVQYVAPKATSGKAKQNAPDVGGTRREASSVPLTVRRKS